MRFGELAQNSEDDEYGKWDIDDTRRPRLTLKHINKMRNIRELRKHEHANEVDEFTVMYGSRDSE